MIPLLDVQVPSDFDAQAAAAWKSRLAEAVAKEIRPAMRRQRDAIRDEVAPRARPDDRAGVMWLPDGEVLYSRAIHRYTTLPMQAGEIHEVGRQQIARLGDEYRILGAEVLGTSDLSAIYRALREDPDLHHTNGAEVVTASETAMATARAAMGDWFGRLPQTDCIVQETKSGPIAFYFPPALDGSRPGVFFMNTADPTSWGRFEIECTSFHEGIPGHHLQIAIAQELGDQVPSFRQHAYLAAFSEGWGLYTERLADEMGLYSSALARMGMLAADSMRACRLVVDTGMHALGWSRQDAIDYMMENSPMSLHTITEEVDRYLVHARPGALLHDWPARDRSPTGRGGSQTGRPVRHQGVPRHRDRIGVDSPRIPRPPRPGMDHAAMNQDLQHLADDYWAFSLRRSPTSAWLLGIHDHDAEIEDLSRRRGGRGD